MNTNRRDFLKGTLWMGAAALAGGALCDAPAAGGAMATFAAPALRKVRVGCVGLGARGSGAVHRISQIPGVEVAAICDIRPEAVAAQQKWLSTNKKPAAKEEKASVLRAQSGASMARRRILLEGKSGAVSADRAFDEPALVPLQTITSSPLHHTSIIHED